MEVALEESGDTVTLMTTEAGGYTLNNSTLTSRMRVTANNKEAYRLTLGGTMWTAALIVP